jgi:EAL domain-containing protein (putative c-di-GMP-specific phosphodiesterase class I)
MRVTASAGVSCFSQDAKRDAAAVLVDAEIAMYQAKEGGRDRVEMLESSGESHSRMRRRVAWSERLRAALEDGGLLLYQQPIFDLRTRAVAAHELLLRMAGDNGDAIPPGAFLPIAEEFGLMQAVDRWVIARAVETIAHAERAGRALRLEVNLSGSSIGDAGVMAFVSDRVTGSGIDPRSLVFEVTETTAIVNIEQARLFARELADLGCAFALDDFGSGFGSFYYLKHLPFDYLKIDGDFIRNLAASRTDQLTVRAIAEIARGLRKRTIAEFVADEASLEILRGYGVDFAQGYFLGRPEPVHGTLIAPPSTRLERAPPV